MNLSLVRRLSLTALAFFSGHIAIAGPEIGPDAASLYKTHCATCHEVPETKAPAIDALRKLPLGKITQALEIGIMQPMATMLKPDERLAIAKWLAAEEDLKRNQWLQTHACTTPPLAKPAKLTGAENWGMGTHNARNPQGVTITKTNLDKLELDWSIALPSVNAMRSLPVATADTIYLGGADARLLALERKTGCVRWYLNVDSAIRNSLTLERTPDGINTIFFADELGTVHAVDATTGVLRWKKSIKIHPTSIVSGAIAYHDGVVFVPISLFEVMVAANPKHECCRAHGGLTALDAQTGEQRWHFATTPNAEKTTLSAAGTQLWGPSGAAVWNRPTIDAKRGVVYFGTGENASSPPTELSDSIVALDLKTGEKRWHFQALANDAWNLACNFKAPNCPKENGPDFDFGASAILVKDGRGKGKDVLLAGQKSGEIFALDPDNKGALLWRHHFTPTAIHFNSNAGIHHGMATDGKTLIVPIADSDRAPAGHKPAPGVHAVSVADGTVTWSHRIERGCTVDPADMPGVTLADKLGGAGSRWPACSFYYAPSAPPTLANGLAYVPTLDGKVHVFDAASGKVLRVFETNRAFTASNGVEGHGGALDVAGVLLNGNQLIIPSGYAPFGQMPGNMLLVYSLKNK